MRPYLILATCFALAGCGGTSAPVTRVLGDADTFSDEFIASQDTATVSRSETGDESFAALLNNVRLETGAGPVRYDARLDRAAQAHADDMIDRDYFAHNSPEGENAYDRIIAQGYSPRAWGENIAARQRTEEEALVGWQNSPSHNQMMTAPVFEDFGFALAEEGVETRWVLVMGTEAD